MPKLSLNASKKTKHTPAGEIPVDWGHVPAKHLVLSLQSGTSLSGENREPESNEVALLKVSAVTSGKFLPLEAKTVCHGQSSKLKLPVRKGQILVNRANGSARLVGTAVYVDRDCPNTYLPDKLWSITHNPATASERFLAFVLGWEDFLKQVHERSSGGTGMRNISSKAYLQIPIPFPPLPEQRRIADILTTWDRAIETLESLIAAKSRRKQALMQQLLTGKKRLPGFDQSKGQCKKDRFGTYPADWEHLQLGQVVSETGKRNSLKGDHPVLSCTKHQGLVLSEEYFGRRVHADDTSNYRIVRRGEFAYATNHIEEGSIGYQDLCDAGLVSPIYTVFKPNKTISPNYLFRVLKSPLFLHLYQVNTSASVDRRGSLRFKEFAQLPIWVPDRKEQDAIAAVFDTIDLELTLHRQHLDSLRTQKRGLMQKLLTGEVRVKP